MDVWWWLALGVIVVVSLVAALVDGGARLGPRRYGRRRGGVPLPDRGPRPGEVWWTRAPRLVLVLAVGLESARVARVTAERPRESRAYEPHKPHGPHEPHRPRQEREPHDGRGNGRTLALPPGTVADAPGGRVSCLRTDTVREVALTEFRHRAGELDPDTWARVRQLTEDA